MEVQAKQFYVHHSHVPGYYYLYKALEKWLADRLLRQDTSRVFCASPTYAFRRRFELTDTSRNFKDIGVTSLDFPFISYWPSNSGWTHEERIAANPAALIYTGIYEGNTKIRAAAGNINIPITLYYDRDSDSRLAYEKLYFYTYNEHYYETDAIYANQTLKLPMVITLNNLQYNPQYTEADWLRQNRIFPITVNINLRSYIIYPPNQPRYDLSVNSAGLLVDKDGNLVNPDGEYLTGLENAEDEGLFYGYYDDGSPAYWLTEEAILNMKDWDGLTLDQVRVNGSIEESNIEINLLAIEDVTKNGFTLRWEINNLDQVEKMEFRYKGMDYIEVDPALGVYEVTGLEPDSTYNLYINIYSKDGSIKRLGRTVNTESSDTTIIGDKVSTEGSDAPSNSLVGLSW